MNTANNEIIKKALTTSPLVIMKAYKDNKDMISAYLKGESIEGYNDDSKTILGFSLGAFSVVFLINLAITIWAIYALVKYGKTLPTWSLILSIVLLFIGGGVFSLILVYVTRGTKSERFSLSYGHRW